MIRLVSKYLFRSPQLVASSTIRDVTTTTPQNYRAGLFTLRQSDNAATYEVFSDMINYEKVCLLELKKKFLHNFEQKFDWRKLFGLKVATVALYRSNTKNLRMGMIYETTCTHAKTVLLTVFLH